jgi:predicted phosphatase
MSGWSGLSKDPFIFFPLQDRGTRELRIVAFWSEGDLPQIYKLQNSGRNITWNTSTNASQNMAIFGILQFVFIYVIDQPKQHFL